MEYYEFHYLVNDLTEHLKSENDRSGNSQEQAGDMMNNMKMPNMKMPTMKMPSMKM